MSRSWSSFSWQTPLTHSRHLHLHLNLRQLLNLRLFLNLQRAK